MGDRAIGPLAALLVTAVVLLGVGLYLRTMYASVHTLLELRQPGPTLPHLPPCEWTLGELEVLADQRQLAIEVVSHDETHRFGPSIPGETSRRMRVSSLQHRDRCVQVLLTIWGSG